VDDEFFITGKKEIKPSKVSISSSVATFLIDKDAEYIYYSKAGGFLPPEQCADSILTNPIHYGAGLFEGMRFYYSPYGTVLVEPWENIGRMMHSATFFNPILAVEIKKIFDNEKDVEEVKLEPIFPRLYYRRCARAYEENRNPVIELEVIKKVDGKRVVEKRPIELKIQAMHGETIREYNMAELDAIIKVLAFTSRLVSIDYFPGTLEMVPSGYIRPFAWVSGEKGLKVPTILKTKEGFDIKPLYLAVATLPWGVYLNEDDYNRGLDVLVAPYQRIGKDMPSDAKIAGNYVNSAININLGAMFGYGEILALNSSKKVIEGSAENIFVIYTGGKDIIVATPPTGSGCLPGTTRDRLIRVIENMGGKIIYQPFSLNDLYPADAILLSGTGAQFIHIRSISTLNAAKKIAEMMHLQSENRKRPLSVKRSDFVEDRKLINNGEKHPVIDAIRSNYIEMLVTNPNLLAPVYDIDFSALANVLDLDKTDFMTKEDLTDESAGYFKEKINGVYQPNELAERTKKAARIIKKAIERANQKTNKENKINLKAR